ncbi:hypothetical protein JCM10213_005060 [Rhodosporidiobolus nylandii]
MPVPSLPLELVALTLTELRLSCDNDDAVRRENGLNVALVCKAWQPLGEGVIWHGLVLDSPEKARKAIKHFEQYKHLARQVRKMHLTASSQQIEAFLASSPSEAGPAAEVVRSLWRLCSSMYSLTLEWVDWADFATLVSYSPQLRSLRQLRVSTRGMNSVDANALLHYLPSLSHLDHLVLTAAALDFAPPTLTPPPAHLLPIRHFAFQVRAGEPQPRVAYLSRLLDLMDPTVVTHVTYCASAEGDSLAAIVSRLLSFPLLRVLFIMCMTSRDGGPVLERALEVLDLIPNRQHVLHLFIATQNGSLQRPVSLPTLPSLAAFLMAIPFMNVDVTTPHFVFTSTRASLPRPRSVLAGRAARLVVQVTCLVRLTDAADGQPSEFAFERFLVANENGPGRSSHRLVWVTVEEGQ